MKRLFASAALVALSTTLSAPALAGVYGDDATRCIVKSASDADQLLLIKWIYSAISRHPELKPFAQPQQAGAQAALDEGVAQTVSRLLSKDCRKEVIAALRYEGTEFLPQSFRAIGEVAMVGIMSNAEVENGLGTWADQLDTDALADVAKEAGRTLPALK